MLSPSPSVGQPADGTDAEEGNGGGRGNSGFAFPPLSAQRAAICSITMPCSVAGYLFGNTGNAFGAT